MLSTKDLLKNHLNKPATHKCSAPSNVTSLFDMGTRLFFMSFILVFRYIRQNYGDHITFIIWFLVPFGSTKR